MNGNPAVTTESGVSFAIQPGHPGWIDSTFCKRECSRYVSNSDSRSPCACGRTWSYHKTHGIKSDGEIDETWSPIYHTVSSPTDSYGTIDFLGGPHPNKAQFIRLGFDTRPDLTFQLLTREWGLKLPKLVISVHGGKANFELNPRVKLVFGEGLLRAAKTTGAWILTGGTSTGVTRHVGDALISERSPRLRGGRAVSIGIAAWGVVENHASLIGRKKDVTYQSIDHPRSKFAALNNRHAYFLLADDGTVGRYGAEILLRRNLEKYISRQRLPARVPCTIPVVCLVVEGGMDTIRTVLEYVMDSPPVPVVVVEGSGRAADLIAFARKCVNETNESVQEGMRQHLLDAILQAFHVDQLQADKLLVEVFQCVENKDLVTIFRPSESNKIASPNELDNAILCALFRARHLSASEQLCLALAWNRVDIARSEIFVYGQEWPQGILEETMMEALVKNRVDFVKLLLEMGVQMSKFLTIARLEELYHSKQGPANTLRYIIRDVRPHMPHFYSHTLIDIGLVVNKLMGGAYRCSYTRRKFRHIYNQLMSKSNGKLGAGYSALSAELGYSEKFGQEDGHNQSFENLQNHVQPSYNLFTQPFNELLVWSVLTKRQSMAKLMWQHGEESLAKALVASKLYRAMASEAADDDLAVEISDELRSYATEFDREALELLDYCYRQDDDLAQQLLTCELSNWSRQTCLRFAFACHHRELLAHPCAQLILGDLWLGGLRTRHSTNLKIVMAILCPAIIFHLEFKSKKELLLMPQTETEHMVDLKDEPLTENMERCSFCSPSVTVHLQKEQVRSTNWKLGDTMNCLEVRDGNNQSGTQCHICSNDISHAASSTDTSQIPNSQNDILHDTTGLECTVIHDHHQLSFHRKVLEFYSAPITKFWTWTMAYFFFLVIYTYTLLIRTPPRPEWNEYYVIIYISSFGTEKVRQILDSEPVNFSRKLAVWASSAWNCCDAFFIIEFFVGLILRHQENTLEHGRVLYCLNIVYWYIRILLILRVSRFLGPFVTMIGWMLKRMVYYVTLMLVVLMSYGVFRQSVLFPHEEFSWFLVRDIFFKPYFMIYGELFADDINPPCGNGTKPDGSFDPEMPPCETGRWLNPLLMTAYLLVVNILMLNLLIAVFNSIFLKTNVYSHKIWKFNRYAVVMEYDQKPTLPPPFIVFSHFFLLIDWIRRQCSGVKQSYDCGLKLFLDKDDLERLYDFEEESMEGLVRERETKQNQSSDERIRLIDQRLENFSSKLDDFYQPDDSVLLDSLESRLTLLEKAIERTTETLVALHVMSQELFPLPMAEQASSMTFSEATTLLANVMEGETWTSTPMLSDSSSSKSEDGHVNHRTVESELVSENYRKDSTSADEPIETYVRTKLERRATTSRLPRKKIILKRQLTEIPSGSENSAVMQDFSASANFYLFPNDVALKNGQLDNIRKLSRQFRADSCISKNGGEKCARSFSTAKMVAETQRLRELEGDVYHMMGGVIRRRRHLDSKNSNASLEEMSGVINHYETVGKIDAGEETLYMKNVENLTVNIEDSHEVQEDSSN